MPSSYPGKMLSYFVETRSARLDREQAIKLGLCEPDELQDPDLNLWTPGLA